MRRRPGRAPEPPAAAGNSERGAPGAPAPPPARPDPVIPGGGVLSVSRLVPARGLPGLTGPPWRRRCGAARMGRRTELGQVGFTWELGLGRREGREPARPAYGRDSPASPARGWSKSESRSPESTKGPALPRLPHRPGTFCLLLSRLEAESQLSLGTGLCPHPPSAHSRTEVHLSETGSLGKES